MTQDSLKQWARRGAEARLAEIERERNDILAAFPDLADAFPVAARHTQPRKPRQMGPAWRAKLAAAAKRRWAEAKKAGRTRL